MILPFLGTIAVWLAIWIIAWRGFYGPMAGRRINYIDGFPVTCVYFLLWSVLVFLLFRDTFARIAYEITPVPFLVLAVVFAVQALLYRLGARRMERPDALIRNNPREMFLRLDYRYLVSKSFEVMFQQVMVVLLILTAWRLTGSLLGTVVVFAAVFAFAHLPMVAIFGERAGFFAGLYMVAAMASAVAFPVVILEVNLGFVYTYAMHTMFFTILGLWFWWRQSRAGTP
ncbi:MAG: hypothetical protein P8181_12530 [bacterium]